VEVRGLVTERRLPRGGQRSERERGLQGALSDLVESAVDLGGNAIIGVTTATFGAHGGITSGFGGDAVGVLITGTAVQVAKDTDVPGPAA